VARERLITTQKCEFFKSKAKPLKRSPALGGKKNADLRGKREGAIEFGLRQTEAKLVYHPNIRRGSRGSRSKTHNKKREVSTSL